MNLKSKEPFNQFGDKYDSWFDRHQAVFQS